MIIHPQSSFMIFHACNGQYEWLSLPFGIESNLFKLLCIEVIFIYNILFLIDIGIIILFLKFESLFMILILKFDKKEYV